MPFHHLNIKHKGKVTPCWRFPNQVGDLKTEKLTDVWNNDAMKSIRQDMIAGKSPRGCKSCRDIERSGAESLRHRARNDIYPNVKDADILANVNDDGSYPLNKIGSVEIRFDNICNLMCRHCSPDYSSLWEYNLSKDKGLMDQQTKLGFKPENTTFKLTTEIMDEIVALAPNLTEIMTTGGEPLYHPDHYDFLERMIPHAHHITLNYNSNFSTLSYKGKSILDVWKHFKEVSIRISVDADPKIYDYLRVGGNLKKVEENIKKASVLPNIMLTGTFTSSMMNITRMIDTIKYFATLGSNFHTSLVQYPRAISVKVLPKELKQQVTQEWENLKSLDDAPWFSNRMRKRRDYWIKNGDNVINYMNGEDWSDLMPAFQKYVDVQDKFHGTSFLTVYPEFKPYWK